METIISLAFAMLFGLAFAMLAAGVAWLYVQRNLVMGRRVGGLQFFTFRHYGGSFYVTRSR
jgi:hypothetical protein